MTSAVSILKAAGLTVGLFAILYFVFYFVVCYRRYLRNRSNSRRAGLGKEPRFWDVSCYPLRPRHKSRSERLELGKGEENECDSNCAVNCENRAMWREFFVSCIRSINPPVFDWCSMLIRFLNVQPLSADEVSDAIRSPRMNRGHPVQCTPTRIQISAIILMPTSPRRPTSSSSTSPIHSSNNTGGYVNQCIDSRTEYALGTSYLPDIPGCSGDAVSLS